MEINFLSFCLPLFGALSLSAVVEANQIQTVNMSYASNNIFSGDVFSGANTFTPVAEDYANAGLVNSILNVNNAVTLPGYAKNWLLESGYLSDFFQGEDDIHAARLSYNDSHEAFLSSIYHASSYGKDNFVNYAVSSVSQNIEVGPEPETYSMMFAGLILMAFVARRRTN
jgi:hypothetical protein